jgi:hypothetical protein
MERVEQLATAKLAQLQVENADASAQALEESSKV